MISSITLCSIPPISFFVPWDDPDDRLLPEGEGKVNNNSLMQYYTHPTEDDIKEMKRKDLKERCIKQLKKKYASKESGNNKR